MSSRIVRIVLPAAIAIAVEQPFLTPASYAITYLTLEEAQSTMLPGVSLSPFQVNLDESQRQAIEALSGIDVENSKVLAWRSSNGDFFIVDNVIGKHEYITYAVSISGPSGAVKQIEILDYRENYGSEIRRPEWRAQFNEKKVSDPLVLADDIKNISGATMSCKHVTEGVKRILATYEIVLKKLP